MTKEIEALETMDEYSDEEYSAYLEYTALKDQCIVEPNKLYIDFFLSLKGLILLSILIKYDENLAYLSFVLFNIGFAPLDTSLIENPFISENFSVSYIIS